MGLFVSKPHRHNAGRGPCMRDLEGFRLRRHWRGCRRGSRGTQPDQIKQPRPKTKSNSGRDPEVLNVIEGEVFRVSSSLFASRPF